MLKTKYSPYHCEALPQAFIEKNMKSIESNIQKRNILDVDPKMQWLKDYICKQNKQVVPENKYGFSQISTPNIIISNIKSNLTSLERLQKMSMGSKKHSQLNYQQSKNKCKRQIKWKASNSNKQNLPSSNSIECELKLNRKTKIRGQGYRPQLLESYTNNSYGIHKVKDHQTLSDPSDELSSKHNRNYSCELIKTSRIYNKKQGSLNQKGFSKKFNKTRQPFLRENYRILQRKHRRIENPMIFDLQPWQQMAQNDQQFIDDDDQMRRYMAGQ